MGATQAGDRGARVRCERRVRGLLLRVVDATAFIESGQAETVLVMGAEVLSRVMNFTTTCVLFGDGAGAVVLRRSEAGVLGSVLGADGRAAEILMIPGAAPPSPRATRRSTRTTMRS